MTCPHREAVLLLERDDGVYWRNPRREGRWFESLGDIFDGCSTGGGRAADED